jgi:aspartate/methionine/tyrosine aminotransferase
MFNPSSPVKPSDLLATNGVTTAIDLLAWSICEPGDTILYPTPNFYMLDFDIASRNGVVSTPVAVERSIHGDPFAPTKEAAAELELAFEKAIDDTSARGLRCRAIFLCNPANPQGRCYSSYALDRLAQLCTRRNMHLIADEIYAMSNFSHGREPFSSVLSVPESSSDHCQNLHCLYGLSKDFSLGGLRIGFVVTRNEQIRRVLERTA